MPRLRHLLRAKAVLCPGLKVSLHIEASGEEEVWQYTGGLADYLDEALGDTECVPDTPFVGSADGGSESASGPWYGNPTVAARPARAMSI